MIFAWAIPIVTLRTDPRHVDRICKDIGFFILVDHGVPEATLRAGWTSVKRFFDQPLATKLAAPQMDAAYPYGYSAVGGEALSGRTPDPKEMFSTGPYNPESGVVAPRYPTLAGFREAWHAYYQSMEGLAARLLPLFARALGVPDSFFEEFSDRHACAMRALNYPRGRPSKGVLRASPHTDYGALTILRSGGPGLQVKNRSSGAWIDVPYLRQSHFVINLGDLMTRWTNDRWVSTPHQVVFKQKRWAFLPDRRRQSIAFFFNLNTDANVSAIRTCVAPGQTPNYPPIRAMDHLMMKHRAAVAAATKKDS